jgi:hypothetical protein
MDYLSSNFEAKEAIALSSARRAWLKISEKQHAWFVDV